MMNDIAIKVENVSKIYKLYDHPLDRLKESLHPFGKKYHHDYYALDNINFEIRKGETVGIIGRNGAGKSTLLKIITGVLNQTKGVVTVNGRIASLLELGAGFNPEMTGIENIFFSGTIMGFTHEEMKTKLEAISAFADIGQFIYQPVKTYSSGMFVRLAFAVNTVVNPDILIIDEALSVGDMLFVQKCMRYIRDYKTKGTLIFVSHDLAALKALCEKSIWIKDAHIEEIGSTEMISNRYLDFIYQQEQAHMSNKPEKRHIKLTVEEPCSIELQNKVIFIENFEQSDSFKTGKAEFVKFSISHNDKKIRRNYFQGLDKIVLKLNAVAYAHLDNPILGFILKDKMGQELFGDNTISYTKEYRLQAYNGDELEASFIFSLPRLQNGQYSIMLSLAEGNNYQHIQHHLIHDAYIMTVNSSDITFGIVNIEFDDINLKIISHKSDQ